MLERQIDTENMGWSRTCNIKEMDSTRSNPDGDMTRGRAGTKKDILCRRTTAQTNPERTCLQILQPVGDRLGQSETQSREVTLVLPGVQGVSQDIAVQ